MFLHDQTEIPSAGTCPLTRLVGGGKDHNMNETSLAHILFATGVPGKSRPVGGELHFENKNAKGCNLSGAFSV